MSFSFGLVSQYKMRGVHPDLVRVMKRAISMSPVDFSVIEGVRTLARQKELLAAHATTTMKSRHLDGHAIDIAPYVGGKIRWDWPLYKQIAPIIKAAAKMEEVPIEWGGDWVKFKDGPHWQLPWTVYPR